MIIPAKILLAHRLGPLFLSLISAFRNLFFQRLSFLWIGWFGLSPLQTINVIAQPFCPLNLSLLDMGLLIFRHEENLFFKRSHPERWPHPFLYATSRRFSFCT